MQHHKFVLIDLGDHGDVLEPGLAKHQRHIIAAVKTAIAYMADIQKFRTIDQARFS